MPLVSPEYGLGLVKLQAKNHRDWCRWTSGRRKVATMGVTPANVVTDGSVNFRSIQNNTHRNWWQDKCQLLRCLLVIILSDSLS